MSHSEIECQRREIESLIETLLPYQSHLSEVINSAQPRSEIDDRLLCAAANTTSMILSYCVFAGVGRTGLLDAMAQSVGARLKSTGDSSNP